MSKFQEEKHDQDSVLFEKRGETTTTYWVLTASGWQPVTGGGAKGKVAQTFDNACNKSDVIAAEVRHAVFHGGEYIRTDVDKVTLKKRRTDVVAGAEVISLGTISSDVLQTG